ETKHAVNDFPRLPVREGCDVVVSLSVLPDEDGLQEHLALLDADLAWSEHVAPALRRRLLAEPAHVVLRPTPRSRLCSCAPASTTSTFSSGTGPSGTGGSSADSPVPTTGRNSSPPTRWSRGWKAG